jgi:hypothetical protein
LDEPGTSYLLDASVPVKGNPTIQDLEEFLEFDIFLPNGKDKVLNKQNRIQLSTGSLSN